MICKAIGGKLLSRKGEDLVIQLIRREVRDLDRCPEESHLDAKVLRVMGLAVKNADDLPNPYKMAGLGLQDKLDPILSILPTVFEIIQVVLELGKILVLVIIIAR